MNINELKYKLSKRMGMPFL